MGAYSICRDSPKDPWKKEKRQIPIGWGAQLADCCQSERLPNLTHLSAL